MSLSAKVVGEDTYRNGIGKFFHVNVKEVEIDGVKFKTPMVAMNQVESRYCNHSSTSTMVLPVMEFVKRFPSSAQGIKPLTEALEYQPFVSKTGKITGWFLQRKRGLNITDITVDNIAELQSAAGASIISHVEKNINQDVNEFEREIDRIEKNYPKKIISPTVDMSTKKEGLLEEKLDSVISTGRTRLNIVHASIHQNQENWLILSEKTFGEKIMINCVGIPRTDRSYDSNIFKAFLFGVDTASVAIPWRGTPNSKSRLLNDDLSFTRIQNAISYEESRAQTLYTSQNILQQAQAAIMSKTFFSGFVPGRGVLSNTISCFQ